MAYPLGMSLALIAGLMMTRIGNKLKLPDVTSYLITGVLLGPCCLGMLGLPGFGFPSFSDVESLHWFSNAALGFIAFAIGSEFRLSHLKKTGSAAVTIGIFQAVFTTLIVDLVMIAVHLLFPSFLSLADAIVLGAIASATAPAATLMVVRQYKARGEVTDTLLPVVALDDAIGLILFAVSFGVAQALNSGEVSLLSVLVAPLLEIILSLILGAALGWGLTHMARMFHSRRNRVSMIVAYIILSTALSTIRFKMAGVEIGFSALLVNMMLGTVFCNCCKASADLMERADVWSAPLMVLFFVLSGAELDVFALANPIVLLICVLYIVSRCIGKYYGARISSRMAHSGLMVQRYLGITLFPQAGVALGMAATVGSQMGAEGQLIRDVILSSVLIYEIIGPSLTKWALTQAHEIHAVGEDDPDDLPVPACR